MYTFGYFNYIVKYGFFKWHGIFLCETVRNGFKLYEMKLGARKTLCEMI